MSHNVISWPEILIHALDDRDFQGKTKVTVIHSNIRKSHLENINGFIVFQNFECIYVQRYILCYYLIFSKHILGAVAKQPLFRTDSLPCGFYLFFV